MRNATLFLVIVLAASSLTAQSLTLTTPAFEDGGLIPAKYTRTQTVWVSPELDWSNVPAGIQSFVLLVHDPDVSIEKTTEDVLHWLIFNIPGDSRGLAEGQPFDPMLPDGSVQAKNRRGGVGFLGPGAPAAGPLHHYTFELFALDIRLDLGPEATRTDVLKAIDGHILGKAALVGRFRLPH
jgi:Raf kinase inhibitor-like YbhB/YbcL family protein